VFKLTENLNEIMLENKRPIPGDKSPCLKVGLHIGFSAEHLHASFTLHRSGNRCTNFRSSNAIAALAASIGPRLGTLQLLPLTDACIMIDITVFGSQT
jgi:hypothetical protein